MRLTTKGRVAVNAMVDLATRRRRGPVSLGILSQRQQVSVSYLEHLFGNLRRHGLVSAMRGPGGGYMLGRDASAISVADIVRAVEATDADAQPANAGAAGAQAGHCATPELWASLNRCMLDFLGGISLQSVASEAVRTEWTDDVRAEAAARQNPARRGRRTEPSRPMPVNSVFALGGAG